MAACELYGIGRSRALGPPAVTPASGVRRRSSDEHGSATVVMLGVILVVLTLTVCGLLLVSAVLASHRSRAAADLAALAAAGALMQGEPPPVACQRAEQVAAANHGLMQQCAAVGTEARISVAVPAGVRGLGVAMARSRAGPGSSGGLSLSK